MVVTDGRKQIIHDLIKAWKYCKEGGSIPLAVNIRKHHFNSIFEQHYEQFREIFCGKPVFIIIIDESTNKKARSLSKSNKVNFMSQVNNVTVGQLVLKTLVEWEIPFTYPYLIVSDLAAYMKKSVRKILQPGERSIITIGQFTSLQELHIGSCCGLDKSDSLFFASSFAQLSREGFDANELLCQMVENIPESL
ncbi:hypothetical protein Glove_21g284 [Diversispora epigaea]|uniref:Uncharacterized protein n=1 Tax=Diversispora epigaea TaxID=1348612 RepID=A0A397JMD7_9GLOM|nr:hypothetical protein Glove_21g284 [Diversispora epigaea]